MDVPPLVLFESAPRQETASAAVWAILGALNDTHTAQDTAPRLIPPPRPIVLAKPVGLLSNVSYPFLDSFPSTAWMNALTATEDSLAVRTLCTAHHRTPHTAHRTPHTAHRTLSYTAYLGAFVEFNCRNADVSCSLPYRSTLDHVRMLECQNVLRMVQMVQMLKCSYPYVSNVRAHRLADRTTARRPCTTTRAHGRCTAELCPLVILC